LNRALEMATKAKQLTPNDPKVSFNLGSVHQDLEQYEKALDWYMEANELGFENKLMIHYNMAICRMRTGNYVEALKQAPQAYKVDPHSNKTMAL